MTDPVSHATFSLERTYPVPPDRVFAAWADPAAKAAWFAGPDAGHTLEFRVGGREHNHWRRDDGTVIAFDSVYQEIVADVRLVYSSTLSVDGTPATVSITTVSLSGTGGETTLVLTEQGTFLGAHEQPGWREEGTGRWLDTLGRALAGAGAGTGA